MTENETKWAIKADNVHKHYQIASQEVIALNGVDLEVAQGEVIAVTGPSGAGKSTLLHVLGTLDKPTSGDVFLNGTNISGMPDSMVSSFRNSTVGFVFQMNNLLPEFSAIENVILPGLIAGHKRQELLERATDLLGSVGLSDRQEHRPGEMSGGEQQRVAIARALLMSPPIILADEPTGNLDLRTTNSVTDLFLDLCNQHNVTMLLVTHDMDLARRLPEKIVVEDGRIVARERH